MIWGLGLQFLFAVIILRTSWGYQAFKWIGDRIADFVNFVDHGVSFVFGEAFVDHFFAMKVGQILVSYLICLNDCFEVNIYIAIKTFLNFNSTGHANHYLCLRLHFHSNALGSDTGSDCLVRLVNAGYSWYYCTRISVCRSKLFLWLSK